MTAIKQLFKAFPVVIALFMVVSCKKGGSSNPSAAADSWVSSINLYSPNSAQKYADSFTYDGSHRTIANPCYHAAISNSIGPLIHILAVIGFGSDFDPISQKAFDVQSSVCCHVPPITVQFALTTDSSGRLTQQTDALGDLETFKYF